MIPGSSKVIGPDAGPHAHKGFIRKLIADIDDYAKGNDEFEVDGTGFMIHLTSMYWGIRGGAEFLIEASVNPFFIMLGVSSEVGGDLASRVWLPFSMKPIYGVLCDLIPIGYYKKRWYFVILAALGTLACMGLSFASSEQLGGTTGLNAFYCFFTAVVAISFCDSLTQGKYSEVAKAKGSSVVSYTYGSKVAAGLIAFFCAGFINEYLGPQVTTMFAIVFFAQMLPVGAMNYVGDTRLKTFCKPDVALMRKDKSIFGLAICIFCVALVLSFFNIIVAPLDLDSDTYNNSRIIFGLVGCSCLLIGSFWCLPFQIARINVYIWVCRIMVLAFSFQLQQWFTSQANVCADSPHFPTTIYQSFGYVCACLAQLFAVWLFENYVVYWYAPMAFWVTTAFTCVGALFDIMILTRTNQYLLSWTGLGQLTWTPTGSDGNLMDPVRWDDIVSFLFGTQALRSLVDTLDSLPATLLLSKLVPKGVEATVFATLAAFSNLGWSMSSQMGARFLALTGFNINSRAGEEECNLGEGMFGMTGIVWGLVVGTIVMPLFTIPLTWVFIPNIRLCDDFVAEVDQARGVEMAEGAPSGGGASSAAGLVGEGAGGTPQLVSRGSLGAWSLGAGTGTRSGVLM